MQTWRRSQEVRTEVRHTSEQVAAIRLALEKLTAKMTLLRADARAANSVPLPSQSQSAHTRVYAAENRFTIAQHFQVSTPTCGANTETSVLLMWPKKMAPEHDKLFHDAHLCRRRQVRPLGSELPSRCHPVRSQVSDTRGGGDLHSTNSSMALDLRPQVDDRSHCRSSSVANFAGPAISSGSSPFLVRRTQSRRTQRTSASLIPEAEDSLQHRFPAEGSRFVAAFFRAARLPARCGRSCSARSSEP